MDSGPDRSPLRSLGSRAAGQLLPLAHASHILDWYFDAEVQLLRFAAVDDSDGAILGRVVVYRPSRSAEEVGYFFERPLGGGKSDSLHPSFGDRFQALEREGQ